MMQPIIRHGPNKSWPRKNRPFYAPSHSRQMSRLSFHLSCLGPITSFQQLSPACLALFTFVADVHAQLLSLSLSLSIHTVCTYTRAPTRDPRSLSDNPERSHVSPSPGRLVHVKRRLGGCGAQAATGCRLGIPLSREEGGYPCSSTQIPSPLVRRRQWWI
jgi:hypothetical protein